MPTVASNSSVKHERGCRDYEVTLTDLFNVFYKLDAARSGAVAAADFEAAMLELGYSAEQARFEKLDAHYSGFWALS
jgi:hypothetical protein